MGWVGLGWVGLGRVGFGVNRPLDIIRGVIAVVAGACAVVVNGAVVEGVEELKLSSIALRCM